MWGKTLIILTCLFVAKANQGQELFFEPEMLAGHRSLTHLHLVKYNFNNRVSVNNLTLFDTEYSTNSNNIFFIRNTISYNLRNGIIANTAIGVKNPGHFATVSLQYKYSIEQLSVSYSVGTTYQKGFTLEQSLITSYTPKISKNLKAYFNLLAIANINTKEYQRGLQQLRIGLINKSTKYGLGVNLDQFNNATKTLFNIGLFIKHNFKTY